MSSFGPPPAANPASICLLMLLPQFTEAVRLPLSWLAKATLDPNARDSATTSAAVRNLTLDMMMLLLVHAQSVLLTSTEVNGGARHRLAIGPPSSRPPGDAATQHPASRSDADRLANRCPYQHGVRRKARAPRQSGSIRSGRVRRFRHRGAGDYGVSGRQMRSCLRYLHPTS